jgi:MazG family protein
LDDPTRLASKAFGGLLQQVATLRGEGGCPWDRAQTAASMRPYVIEEAHEVVEAIDAGDPARLADELGDLLLQVVFQAQLAAEQGLFDAGDVCRSIVDKMERRHPHVFGDGADAGGAAPDAAAVLASWERIKAREKRDAPDREDTVLSGVPAAMPALLRAARLSDKASAVGFDWPSVDGVLDKVEEEIGELREAVTGDGAGVEHELGDLLFALANLGRTLSIGAEDALRAANDRFVSRFHVIERTLSERGVPFEEATLEQMEALWQQAKIEEAGN